MEYLVFIIKFKDVFLDNIFTEFRMYIETKTYQQRKKWTTMKIYHVWNKIINSNTISLFLIRSNKSNINFI